MPGPGDLAETEIIVLERPSADGPFGAKGPGEMCANPQIPAVANAIFDAVGVRIDTLPITPERILRALKAQHAASPTCRPAQASRSLPHRPRCCSRGCREQRYLADEGLATAIFLAIRLGKPLLLEGAPGVGKTEAAKVIADILGAAIWCGCSAMRASMPRTRSTNGTISGNCSPSARRATAKSISTTIASLSRAPCSRFCRRPTRGCCSSTRSTAATTNSRRCCSNSCPTSRSRFPSAARCAPRSRPIVVLTSNRTRELAEALRRRCVYHWIGYPDAAREAAIIMARAGDVAEATARQSRRPSGRSAPGRSPSRRASPKQSNGPTRRRCWKRAEAPGRKRFAGRSACSIKDEEDLQLSRCRNSRPHRRGGAGMTPSCRCRASRSASRGCSARRASAMSPSRR